MNTKFAVAAAALALAVGAATSAGATTFTGSYATSYNSSDSAGLPITVTDATPGPGAGFSFNLNSVGQSQSVNLFNISTSDTYVDGNDGDQSPFSLTFNFTAPTAATGSVSGDTEAVTFLGIFSKGVLNWDNGGNTTLNFGSYGKLLVHVDDVDFAGGWGSSLNPRDPATVAAKFTLQSATAAVPEPMTWALMLVGFGGLGAALRANRRQGVALTA